LALNPKTELASFGQGVYGDKKFLVIFGILVTSVIIDITLVRVYDVVSKRFISAEIKEIVFGLTTISCLTAQYILLSYVKPSKGKNRARDTLRLRLLYGITRLVQYGIGAVALAIAAQIFLFSYYSSVFLLLIIIISYTLSIGILSVFLVRVLARVLAQRMSLVMLAFVVTLGFLTLNVCVAMIDASLRLDDRPSQIRFSFGGSMDVSKGRLNSLDQLFFYSFILSFISAWVASSLMLRHYAVTIGRVRYWSLIISPMIFFIAQFAAAPLQLLAPIIHFDQFVVATVVTIVLTLSKPIGGFLIGMQFWVMAKYVTRSNSLRTYLLVSGFGFFLLFTCNQAILLSIAPYPPFGASTLTVVGFSAYLLVVGIYTSSALLSGDSELRKSLRRFATTQSKLIDPMVSMEVQKEIEEKVKKIINLETVKLQDLTGIEASLDEPEIQRYLNEVMKEVRKK
jgi:hypothetical protein